jgi:hypothetical protein
MPQMTDERVRAGLTREEHLSLLHEVIMKTVYVSHLSNAGCKAYLNPQRFSEACRS